MADFKIVFVPLIKHEGGYVDDPDDPGGATNLGVTLEVWKRYGNDLDGDGDIDKEDVKLLTKDRVFPVYKKQYWDCLCLDSVNTQSIADIIFDHGVNAGTYRSARMAQKILKDVFKLQVAEDGKLGLKTVALINSVDQAKFFKAFVELRKLYYLYRVNELPANSKGLIPFFTSIKLSPSNKAKKFRNGWLDRVDSFRFAA